ncbi:MAG: DUF6600 domain-containing protein [Candidatus Aminicenantaceae bacterium]
MKKYLIILSVVFGIMLAAGCIYYVPYPEEGYPPSEDQGYYEEDYRDYPSRMDTSYFYDYLAPYGVWVNYSPYGYVWTPYGTRYGWRPYTYGRWFWTSHGWTWISSYEWGWAPFHYGRWSWDVSLGWFWVPGNIWGPAWVSWRNGGAYIGWAPLPPDVEFVFGVGIRTLPYPIPDTLWVFVDGQYFLHSGIYSYVLPVERNYTIVRTTISKTNIMDRNRVILNQGIDVETVNQLTKTKVSKYEIVDSSDPQAAMVRSGEIQVHRPRIRENDRATPRTVLEVKEAKEAVTKSKMEPTAEDTSRKIESRLKEEQVREVERMQESQTEEVKRITRTKEKEAEKAKTTEEKKVVEKKYESQITEVKQKHKTEKTLIKQRHEKEEKKAKEVKSKTKKTEKKEVKETEQSKVKKTKKIDKEGSKESKTGKTKKI